MDADAEDVHARLERQYNEIAVLAGGLAHEVRNPLSTIRLNLDLLSEELQSLQLPNGHRMLRKLKTIQNQCGQLEDVLEAFLQFTRAGELALEESNLAELIRNYLETYQSAAEQHRLDIRPHLAADLPNLPIDRRLFRQMLDNLIRNAQQAMPQGGQLDIQVFRRNNQVVLELIDTGCGISPLAVDKVFNAFFSTRNAGSGLGLPTVRKIVEAHGGTIRCESEPGRGTRFTIHFPIPQPGSEPGSQTAREPVTPYDDSPSESSAVRKTSQS